MSLQPACKCPLASPVVHLIPSSHRPTPLSFLLPPLLFPFPSASPLPGVNNSALNTNNVGTTASASIVPLLFRLFWWFKSIATATSRFFKIEGRTRGHSSLRLDSDDECVDGDDERGRNGEKEDKLRERFRLRDRDGGESEDVESRCGEGRRGNGILISV